MTTLNTIIDKYNRISFEIVDFHGDNIFDEAALKDFLQPILVHIYGKADHVGPIERSVCTVKESCRSTCNGIPHKRITTIMVRSLIAGIIDMINVFLSGTGISDSTSRRGSRLYQKIIIILFYILWVLHV